MTPLVRNIIVCVALSSALYVASSSIGGKRRTDAHPSVHEPAPVRLLSAEEQKDRLELAARKTWLDYVDRLKEGEFADAKVIGFYRANEAVGASNSAGAYTGQSPDDLRARARSLRLERESQLSSRLRAIAEADALEKRAMAANPRYWGLEIQRIRDEESGGREGP